MERHEAYAIAIDVASWAIYALDGLTKHMPAKLLLTTRLDEVQTRLEDSCQILAQGEADAEFDDLYVPLFDALGYVRSARQFCDRAGVMTYLRAVIVQLCRHAIESLDGISTPIHAA